MAALIKRQTSKTVIQFVRDPAYWKGYFLLLSAAALKNIYVLTLLIPITFDFSLKVGPIIVEAIVLGLKWAGLVIIFLSRILTALPDFNRKSESRKVSIPHRIMLSIAVLALFWAVMALFMADCRSILSRF